MYTQKIIFIFVKHLSNIWSFSVLFAEKLHFSFLICFVIFEALWRQFSEILSSLWSDLMSLLFLLSQKQLFWDCKLSYYTVIHYTRPWIHDTRKPKLPEELKTFQFSYSYPGPINIEQEPCLHLSCKPISHNISPEPPIKHRTAVLLEEVLTEICIHPPHPL